MTVELELFAKVIVLYILLYSKWFDVAKSLEINDISDPVSIKALIGTLLI